MKEVFYGTVVALLVTPALADGHWAIATTDGVEIMQTVGDTKPEDAVAKWAPEHRAKVLSITPLKPTDKLPDRAFRSAWTFDKTKKQVGVDMPKAKEIMKEKMADAILADALAKADKAAKDAVLGKTPSPQPFSLFSSEGEALTDDKSRVPVEEIDNAKTPEELLALWPKDLPKGE